MADGFSIKILEQLKISNQLKCLELAITISKNGKYISNSVKNFFKDIAYRLGIDLEYVG